MILPQGCLHWDDEASPGWARIKSRTAKARSRGPVQREEERYSPEGTQGAELLTKSPKKAREQIYGRCYEV